MAARYSKDPVKLAFLNGLVGYINSHAIDTHTTMDALLSVIAQVMEDSRTLGSTDEDLVNEFAGHLREALADERRRREDK